MPLKKYKRTIGRKAVCFRSLRPLQLQRESRVVFNGAGSSSVKNYMAFERPFLDTDFLTYILPL